MFGVFSLAVLGVSGLDERFGWSAHFALVVQLAALLVYTVSYLIFSWAMMSNPFFSSLVRIQEERHHTVVTGPYRFVRHPGYASMYLSLVALPIALSSWWALIPALLAMVTLAIRTSLEDRTLLAELNGYADYARRVRYRLMPGVW